MSGYSSGSDIQKLIALHFTQIQTSLQSKCIIRKLKNVIYPR